MWLTLRQHPLLMAVLISLGGALGYSASMFMTPVYTSSATLFVTVAGAKSANDVSQTGTYLTSRMKSYVTLATSAAVLEEALADIQNTETFERLLTAADPASSDEDLNVAADQLQRVVAVANEVDTTVLIVSVDGASRADAQRLTDAVSVALAKRIEATEQGANEFAPIRATVINDADLPAGASSPKPYLNTVLGAAAGFTLGAALSIFMSSRPVRPARTGLPALRERYRQHKDRRQQRRQQVEAPPKSHRAPVPRGSRSTTPDDVRARR